MELRKLQPPKVRARAATLAHPGVLALRNATPAQALDMARRPMTPAEKDDLLESLVLAVAYLLGRDE